MRAEEFNTYRTLWHTSPRTNRGSIMSTGFEPRIQLHTHINRTPGIYMFETLPQAKEWAFWSAMTDLEPFDVWEIRVPRSYKLVRDRHDDMDIYNAVIGYDAIPPEHIKLIKTQGVPKSSKRAPPISPKIPSDIDEALRLMEGRNHPIICVDVQPEYSGMNDGDESAVFPEIINFVNNQTGPVLMFVNAEDQGLSGDTVASIRQYWEDTIRGEDYDYDDEDAEPTDSINWDRFTIVDKGYGYFRAWMDAGISPAVIIRVIRAMYQLKISDSREFEDSAVDLEQLVGSEWDAWMWQDPITVNWTSVAQLKRFNGAYIVGGGREECLREVEILMSAFNIKYKRIDSLVY